MRRSRNRIGFGLLMSWAALAGLLPASVGAEAAATALGDRIAFRSAAPGEVTLRVVGADDFVFDGRFGAGATPEFSLVRADGSMLADGIYTWEMRAVVPSRARAEADAGGGSDRGDVDALASGTFLVRDGAIVPSVGVEERPVATAPRRLSNLSGSELVPLDQVIADDLIVQGSTCVGVDCVNNESFGFDTIRLKENNTRLKFDDTSASAGFPANDWQLTANDSASGGANKFSIDDITGSKIPFTLTAGAATNSIFVDSVGRVGLRTGVPVLAFHVNTSDTPGLRLEQNNSGGFQAQTWDIAGNEANFFVRDVTNGSQLSFRIRPGAPTSSLDIGASGDVGIGTGSPSVKLHVTGTDGSNSVLVEEKSTTTGLRNLLTLRNNGGIQMLYDRTDGTSNDWQTSNFGATFQISVPGASPAQFSLQANGNLAIGGTLSQGSSRAIKENFVPVDSREILRRVSSLPLSSWNTIADPDQRHLGPFAEDWFAAFGLGPDDRHVSISDLSGVALAAIQGLNAELVEREQRIEAQETRLNALEAQNAALLARLDRLETSRTSPPR